MDGIQYTNTTHRIQFIEYNASKTMHGYAIHRIEKEKMHGINAWNKLYRTQYIEHNA